MGFPSMNEDIQERKDNALYNKENSMHSKVSMGMNQGGELPEGIVYCLKCKNCFHKDTIEQHAVACQRPLGSVENLRLLDITEIQELLRETIVTGFIKSRLRPHNAIIENPANKRLNKKNQQESCREDCKYKQ